MHKNNLSVEEYLKNQGRFAHMFQPGNERMLLRVQKEVNKNRRSGQAFL